MTQYYIVTYTDNTVGAVEGGIGTIGTPITFYTSDLGFIGPRMYGGFALGDSIPILDEQGKVIGSYADWTANVGGVGDILPTNYPYYPSADLIVSAPLFDAQLPELTNGFDWAKKVIT